MRKPVAVALGLVPQIVDRARTLPGHAAKLPLRATGTAIAGIVVARRVAPGIIQRGGEAVARLRGAADEIEDRVEDVVKRTPAAGLYERVEDLAEDTAARVRQLRPAGTGASPSVPEAEAPKGEPTPKETQPDSTRVDTAATPDVVETVERVTAEADVSTPTHDELPLPDYDHMTLGSLRARIRSLPVEELVQLREYEKAHADRLPVVTLLDNRIAKLATGDAEPTGNASLEPAPEQRAKPKASKGKANPATRGPAINPPSHGVPTNPSQPPATT